MTEVATTPSRTAERENEMNPAMKAVRTRGLGRDRARPGGAAAGLLPAGEWLLRGRGPGQRLGNGVIAEIS